MVSGELLAADLVTVPSNRGARVLSSRSYGGGNFQAARARADAALALAEAELALGGRSVRTPTTRADVAAVLADAEALLSAGRGPARRATEKRLADILTATTEEDHRADRARRYF